MHKKGRKTYGGNEIIRTFALPLRDRGIKFKPFYKHGRTCSFHNTKSFYKKMATRIRLQRHGRKSYAFYSIVIADVRAPRDGKFIEKLGTYNPNTNPATVDLNFERALYWVECGAQPTDTVRNILSDEGVLLMKHLNGGVKKGAFDEAAAKAKFEAWKQEKAAKSTAFAAAKAEAKKAEKVAEKKAAEAAAKAEAEAAAKAEAEAQEQPAEEANA